jgi:hypothetical protein
MTVYTPYRVEVHACLVRARTYLYTHVHVRPHACIRTAQGVGACMPCALYLRVRTCTRTTQYRQSVRTCTPSYLYTDSTGCRCMHALRLVLACTHLYTHNTVHTECAHMYALIPVYRQHRVSVHACLAPCTSVYAPVYAQHSTDRVCVHVRPHACIRTAQGVGACMPCTLYQRVRACTHTVRTGCERKGDPVCVCVSICRETQREGGRLSVCVCVYM